MSNKIFQPSGRLTFYGAELYDKIGEELIKLYESVQQADQSMNVNEIAQLMHMAIEEYRCDRVLDFENQRQ